MNKAVLIVWLVLAAICLGIGIWHGVQTNYAGMLGFIVVGIGTVVVGVIRYKRMKDEQNKKDDE